MGHNIGPPKPADAYGSQQLVTRKNESREEKDKHIATSLKCFPCCKQLVAKRCLESNGSFDLGHFCLIHLGCFLIP